MVLLSPHFNSNMVRLKALDNNAGVNQAIKFQFQYGSIKR